MKNKERIANLENQLIELKQQVIGLQHRLMMVESTKWNQPEKYWPVKSPKWVPDTSAPTWRPGDIIC